MYVLLRIIDWCLHVVSTIPCILAVSLVSLLFQHQKVIQCTLWTMSQRTALFAWCLHSALRNISIRYASRLPLCLSLFSTYTITMRLNGLDFHVYSKGQPLPEYEVRKDRNTRTITAFIPSQAGKVCLQFSEHWIRALKEWLRNFESIGTLKGEKTWVWFVALTAKKYAEQSVRHSGSLAREGYMSRVIGVCLCYLQI